MHLVTMYHAMTNKVAIIIDDAITCLINYVAPFIWRWHTNGQQIRTDIFHVSQVKLCLLPVILALYQQRTLTFDMQNSQRGLILVSPIALLFSCSLVRLTCTCTNLWTAIVTATQHNVPAFLSRPLHSSSPAHLWDLHVHVLIYGRPSKLPHNIMLQHSCLAYCTPLLLLTGETYMY